MTTSPRTGIRYDLIGPEVVRILLHEPNRERALLIGAPRRVIEGRWPWWQWAWRRIVGKQSAIVTMRACEIEGHDWADWWTYDTVENPWGELHMLNQRKIPHTCRRCGVEHPDWAPPGLATPTGPSPR